MKNGDRCPICSTGHLRNEVSDFQFQVDWRGTARNVVVLALKRFKCDSCGEEFLDAEASRLITNAQRKALGLLSPDEIRGLRNALGKTQAEMSLLLGVGEKTFSRWESGSHFQSDAFDRYLRLLTKSSEALRILEEINSEQATGTDELTRIFCYVQNIPAIEAQGRKFLSLMQRGAFSLTA